MELLINERARGTLRFMDDVCLIRYYADLPLFDEGGPWPDENDVKVQAWTSAAAALTHRGDMMTWGYDFAHTVMVARSHGWRSPLVDAVMSDKDPKRPFRVGDRSAYELSVALRTALDKGDDEGNPVRIHHLIAFCERGGFDVA